MTDKRTLAERDAQTVFHSFTNLKGHAHGQLKPHIIESGKGVFIYDQEGRELLDAFAGLYCVNIGYGRTEVAEAIYEQAKQLAYYHNYVGHSNEPLIRLSEQILSMAPANMSKVYYGLSGSDANELQVKLVWYYNNVRGLPKKKKIISRQRGYHGGTIISGSLTGLPVYHVAFDMPVGPILHTMAPHYYWNAEAGMSEREFSRHCAQKLEEMILAEGPDTVGAFIGEPVMGTGGIIPPPEGYWQEIQQVLDKYDVLLISDEVVCGFGRVGDAFGAIRYGMKPDLMTCAKGLTSAYAPLSAVIVGNRVWEVLEAGSDQFGPIGHGYTYSGHPIGTAAALANLAIIEQDGLADNARSTGEYLLKSLTETLGDHPMVGEVRGVGMLAAIEFVADRGNKTRFEPALKVGARLAGACMEENLISRAMPHGDILGFAPPLVLSRSEADLIVERTRRAVEKVADGLTREGAWKG